MQEKLRYLEQLFLIKNINTCIHIKIQIKKIGNIPDDIIDIWKQTGSNKEHMYTWDCLKNDNLKLETQNGKSKPRCRFDRIYFRNSENFNFTPVDFHLTGLDRLETSNTFCSDHWAIKCEFNY